MLILVALLAAGVAAEPPPAAGASVCAALPESGPVAQRGADVIAVPVPTGDRNLHCPDGFQLDFGGRMPLCHRPGIKVVDGNPRAACYAVLPLGPLAPIAPRTRPTRTCSKRTTTSIIRLTGTNVGLSDVMVTAVPDAGITITTLTDTSSAALEAENPVLQNCFGFQCRLVKLEIAPRAAPVVELRVALPDRDPVGQVLKLPEYCPR